MTRSEARELADSAISPKRREKIVNAAHAEIRNAAKKGNLYTLVIFSCAAEAHYVSNHLSVSGLFSTKVLVDAVEIWWD